MPREEPLLAPRHSSEHSSIRSEDEEDALLTGQRINRPEQQRGWAFWRQVGLFTWSLVATVAVIILAVLYQHSATTQPHGSDGLTWGPGGKPTGKRNVIFMVSDGMGPTSLSLTRSFRQLEQGLPIDDTLVIDQHQIGTSRTRSSSSLITDSAAGATAFSCGHKSYNGAISVLPNHTACGTVLEAAHLAGYKTGLVVTTRITDATPACFASHANRREYEDLIAEQEVGEHPLGRVVDLLLGGGRCHFLPQDADGGCRADDRDLTKVAEDKGFHYINDRDGFDGLALGQNAELPLLGLFAEKDIPFEIDRRQVNDVYPSLEEMARTALAALSKATEAGDKGFFIMIEGSRIDHAGHGNDPAAQVHEVLAYDRAFAAVLDFIDKEDTPTVLVSTSDHETGGLAVARQLHKSYPEYKWLPDVLAKASHSSEYLENKLNEYLGEAGAKNSLKNQRAYVREELLKKGLGIDDATDEEVDSLLTPDADQPPKYFFADMISRRAQVGWSTHGHSGADVNIYASSSKDVWPLLGNHENIEVGKFLASYLDLDVDAVTEKLSQQDSLSWLGDQLGANIRVDQLDSYHGDFRKRGEDCGCDNH
ncbi:alkaline phosphatase Pho8 [Talaromyces proteolyticus]|uniref:Alkaline phosphatase n=1 Tax=Talaromyces proteolyticus TaxID=1131652 RepID=A0AAD4Q008_9EURO|nr:alkaline phosphatase Pho8 [Talaromyces proteolyticus]KAH8700339.1 alkaline phosphatase Pho8 [Talaromyces proteolyticus]